MIFESSASALNIRLEPAGRIVGEMRLGDRIEIAAADSAKEWVFGKVSSGVSAGVSGHVRRRWLIQSFDQPPQLGSVDRSSAAQTVASRTTQFDPIVTYGLGSKAKSWADLQKSGIIDCSGWIYLLAQEILNASGKGASAKKLSTYSDEQITNAGGETGVIISGRYLTPAHFQPGVIVGIDNAEYSWDRHRPLDIDHIVILGEDANGIFVSQSSSSGGGVNRVSFARWWAGTSQLATLGRVHLVDLLAL